LRRTCFSRENEAHRQPIINLQVARAYDISFREGPDRAPIARVRALAVTSENKILIGGTFTNIGGFSRPYFARLKEAGELDLKFLNNLSGPNDSESAILMGRSGDVFVGGVFMRFNGDDRPSIARASTSMNSTQGSASFE